MANVPVAALAVFFFKFEELSFIYHPFNLGMPNFATSRAQWYLRFIIFILSFHDCVFMKSECAQISILSLYLTFKLISHTMYIYV